jgi:hypothetical protein
MDVVNVETIIQKVREEFGPIAERFKAIPLRMDGLNGAEFEATKKPGVYVFVHDKLGCLKVGKSQSNACKRALQHCGADNTTSKDGSIEMAKLPLRNDTHLLCFALQDRESMHWVLALEHFLENTLHPTIKSVRNG